MGDNVKQDGKDLADSLSIEGTKISIGVEIYVVDKARSRNGFLLAPEEPEEMDIPVTYFLRNENLVLVEKINETRYEAILEPNPGKLPVRRFLSVKS